MKSKYICLFIFLIEFLGSLCFFYGFFPASTLTNRFSSMTDLPYYNNSKIENSFFAYKKHYDKYIVMIIDSLRYDFVEGEEVYFPYLHDRLSEKDSCLIKAKVQSPTVTLPRLKSLLTGAVSGFLDVISNFGNSELNMDNFIKQAKANGLKSIFYGDETWINLLPHDFDKSEGTTSFYVSDYTEVDLNVTRNVKAELYRDNWDIMILHYLGLDHIGHLEGPRSKLIKPKLLEMDNVIALINEKFKEANSSALLIICGDHGMKDSGGHGGTSLSETLVPIAILNYNCDKRLSQKEFRQIDLTPLLSVLLGIPIPADSIGKLDYEILNYLEKQHALYALLYNALRLSEFSDKFNLIEGELEDKISDGISKGIKHFKAFLSNHEYVDYLNSSRYLSHIQEILSDTLVNINVKYDLFLMCLGISLLFQSLFLSIYGIHSPYQICLSSIFLCTTWVFVVHYIFCHFVESSSVTCSLTLPSAIITFSIYSLFVTNLFLIDFTIKLHFKANLLHKILFMVTSMHCISLASSSYIEEEHQFWYFFCVSFFLFNFKTDKLSSTAVLLLHRFLRHLNQTGDKWAVLPDIEDWLIENNFIFMLLLFTSSLLSIYFFCSLILSNISSFLTNIFTAFQFFFIFLYKIVSSSIKIPHFQFINFYGVVLARCFWICTFIKSFLILKTLLTRVELAKIGLYPINTSVLLELTLLILSLICKPHNLVIFSALLFYNFVLVKNYVTYPFSLICLHYYMGKIFYFYLGNSNSLSTIDVSAGYVGLESFNIYITGFYIALNTFGAPIVTFLLTLDFLAKNYKLTDYQAEIFRFYTIISASQLIWFSIIITIQRDHIFIWSVFAPKLLYILAHIVLYAVLICVTLLISFWSLLIEIFSKKTAFKFGEEELFLNKNKVV